MSGNSTNGTVEVIVLEPVIFYSAFFGSLALGILCECFTNGFIWYLSAATSFIVAPAIVIMTIIVTNARNTFGPYENAFYAFIGVLGFCLGFGTTLLFSWFNRKLKVYDVRSGKIRRLREFRIRHRGCSGVKVAIVSWKWDIPDASKFSESKTLADCFHRAKEIGVDYLLLDVVTLEQKAVDADMVLRFVKLYSELPVLVGVGSSDDLSRYYGRFWTNVEMQLYRSNRIVYTLNNETPRPQNDMLGGDTVNLARETSVSCTSNLDRVRVVLLELPLPTFVCYFPLKVIKRAQKKGKDISVEAAIEVIDFFQPSRDWLLVEFYRATRFMPYIWLCVLMFPLKPTDARVTTESGKWKVKFACVAQIVLAGGLAVGLYIYSRYVAPPSPGSDINLSATPIGQGLITAIILTPLAIRVLSIAWLMLNGAILLKSRIQNSGILVNYSFA